MFIQIPTQEVIEKANGVTAASAGISLGMRPAYKRRRYIVTTSLIGWVHT